MPRLEWLFVIALVFYTIVIWTHWLSRKKRPELTRWMLVMFGIALTLDICATIFVCSMQAKVWIWNLHTFFGLVAVLIMGLHFAWALDATIRNRGNCLVYFNRCSLMAWVIWLASFITGIPRH